MRTKTTIPTVLLALCCLVALPACSSYRAEGDGVTREQNLQNMAVDTRSAFRAKDPTIIEFFDRAHGYAIFPRVTKGAAGVGAAHGNGVVYERGRLIGYAEVTQVNIGLQLGGQSFSQVVFFEDKAALERFKEGKLEFSANASAVAAESGAAASNDYESSVAVFSMVRGGLMYEASVGGQSFDYTPAR